ncbi:MAG TPA: Calx-beta domain-containing protein [Steroidobacteraceae bacterium]|nr:Calx-beta domain-containing protein [Steroidobacteraceae bacterium]
MARNAHTASLLCCAFLLLLCSGCGGGGDSSASTPPAPLAPPSGIGAAGGTINHTSGAKVVVPAGALAANTAIAVAQSAAGAPALPAGAVAKGQIFAFTPHGTTFATPVTITVPFDASAVPAGMTLALYKTNASQSAWEVVAGATVNGDAMSGQVSSFSYAVVASPPAIDESLLTEKTWVLTTHSRSASTTLTRNDLTGDSPQLGGKVEQYFFDTQIGLPLPLIPPDLPVDSPIVGAYSNDTGRTFWTLAIAPHGPVQDPGAPIGDDSKLSQLFSFEVTEDKPSLHFLITASTVDVIDYGGAAVGPATCPWLAATASTEQLEGCAAVMTDAAASFHIRADSFADAGTFYDAGALIDLGGIHGEWNHYIQSSGEHALWTDADFLVDEDVDGDGNRRHARISLKAPVRVDVPIEHLHKGDVFVVFIDAASHAENRVQGESFVGAYLRDPASSSGIDVASTGLKMIPPRHDVPSGFPALGCPGGPNPAAGTLQLRAADFSTPETAGRASVVIERVGGTQGLVSVRLATSDGTAVSGSDYQASSTAVRFADGEGGERVVLLPVLNDGVAEEDETIEIALSGLEGCATLGAQQAATLTILDDDRPPPPVATFTLGGTVSGLTGSGLVLKDFYSGNSLAASNGVFTFANAFGDGVPYDIRVDTSPSNPAQQCTVTRGVGTISGANVTDVLVECAAPPPSGALDTTFGDGGRATSSFPYTPGISNAHMGMALQADGKILLVGGLTLLRFNPDGTIDTAFGSAGKVTVPFTGSVFDTAQDVAVQADGKIIVVGLSGTGSNDDFALARFNSDGTIDPTFGTNGRTLTDFLGSTDQARRVLIQPDGRILVAGLATATISSTLSTVGFGLARYDTNGVLDASFASGGKARDIVVGEYDVANGIALQADGKIVLAGSAAQDGATDPDVGLVRYIGASGGVTLPGWRDDTFGSLGNGTVSSDLELSTGFEEADDVAVAADGSIVVTGTVRAGSTVGGSDFGFVIATFSSDGSQQTGAALITKFSNQSDKARRMLIQPDGKIVVVGQSASLGANPDMAIVRYAATGLSYDTSFGDNGLLTVDFFGGRDGAEAVVQQPDGKLVLGGFARLNGTTVMALTRVNP